MSIVLVGLRLLPLTPEVWTLLAPGFNPGLSLTRSALAIVAKRQRSLAQAVAYPGGVCKAWDSKYTNIVTRMGHRNAPPLPGWDYFFVILPRLCTPLQGVLQPGLLTVVASRQSLGHFE